MPALSTYQARLESRRHEIQERLGLVTAAADLATGNLVDQAATHGERLLVFASRQQLFTHLREVEAALQRLSEGRYGLCVACRAAIPPARLRVFPEAAQCVPCASAEEQRVRAGVPIRWSDEQC